MSDALLFVTREELVAMERILFTYFTTLKDDEVGSPHYIVCCSLNIKIHNVMKSGHLKKQIISIPPDR